MLQSLLKCSKACFRVRTPGNWLRTFDSGQLTPDTVTNESWSQLSGVKCPESIVRSKISWSQMSGVNCPGVKCRAAAPECTLMYLIDIPVGTLIRYTSMEISLSALSVENSFSALSVENKRVVCLPSTLIPPSTFIKHTRVNCKI